MCSLNVIVVLEFISRDLYLLFAIHFSSKFQNSVFYQHMRPKSGLKFPRPLRIFTKIQFSQKIPNLQYFIPHNVPHNHLKYEPSRGKTNNVVSEQVQHKSGCIVTEAG